MLLENETLPLCFVQFSSMDDHAMSCVINARVWLTAYFAVILMIHMITTHIYLFFLILHTFCWLFSPCYRTFLYAISPYIRLRSYADKEISFYMFILLIKEIVFVLIYVLLAFLYAWFGWTGNGGYVTSLDFGRWLIEASCAPYFLIAFIGAYYLGFLDILFDEYQLFHFIGMTLKIQLFFWMRYAESQDDFFVNHIQTAFVRYFCRSVIRHNANMI